MICICSEDLGRPDEFTYVIDCPNCGRSWYVTTTNWADPEGIIWTETYWMNPKTMDEITIKIDRYPKKDCVFDD